MEREREGEKHQCVVASHTPPPHPGDQARNPGTCPDWFGSQAATQSPEPHQPGLIPFYTILCLYDYHGSFGSTM